MRELSIEELEKLQELNTLNSEMKKIVNVFLEAVNDWPNPISDLYDYEKQVNNFICGEPTKKKIEVALVGIDFSRDAWQSESLSVLLDVFKYYTPGISLKEINEKLKKDLKF
jgi:hypothetical protein